MKPLRCIFGIHDWMEFSSGFTPAEVRTISGFAMDAALTGSDRDRMRDFNLVSHIEGNTARKFETVKWCSRCGREISFVEAGRMVLEAVRQAGVGNESDS